jgi:phosphoribosylpyrophosphate synthetase
MFNWIPIVRIASGRSDSISRARPFARDLGIPFAMIAENRSNTKNMILVSITPDVLSNLEKIIDNTTDIKTHTIVAYLTYSFAVNPISAE